jgi:hypothetical protein
LLLFKFFSIHKYDSTFNALRSFCSIFYFMSGWNHNNFPQLVLIFTVLMLLSMFSTNHLNNL